MDDSARQTVEKARAAFEKLVGEIRPELHRYCTRMTGSVADGEDVVQETLAKAFYLLPQMREIANLRSWLFRMAHNKAVDWTRGYARRFGEALEDHPEIASESGSAEEPLEAEELAKRGLAVFLKLTPAQRGAVILKDVLGYSLEEIAGILNGTTQSIKSALHRGRAALRKLGASAGERRLVLEPGERALLQDYVRHFVAGDFDRLRQLLARDVELRVVGVVESRGAEHVGQYFHRYRGIGYWRMQIGVVEGRAAILVFDGEAPESEPGYFILIDAREGKVTRIRDYRYARHVMGEAEYQA